MRTAAWETAFQITLKNCSEEVTGGTRIFRSFATKGQVVRNVKRLLLIKENQISRVKEFSVFLCKSLGSLKSFLWYARDARLWVHWNHCFDMHLSYLGPVSCIFTSWVSSGLTTGSGCSLMAARWQVFFSDLSFLRAHQLTLEGCNRWWLWRHLFIDMTGNIPFINIPFHL